MPLKILVLGSGPVASIDDEYDVIYYVNAAQYKHRHIMQGVRSKKQIAFINSFAGIMRQDGESIHGRAHIISQNQILKIASRNNVIVFPEFNLNGAQALLKRLNKKSNNDFFRYSVYADFMDKTFGLREPLLTLDHFKTNLAGIFGLLRRYFKDWLRVRLFGRKVEVNALFRPSSGVLAVLFALIEYGSGKHIITFEGVSSKRKIYADGVENPLWNDKYPMNSPHLAVDLKILKKIQERFDINLPRHLSIGRE